MLKELLRYLIVAAAGFALWQWGQAVAGTNEIWDTRWFPQVYGLALGLSAAFGLVFHERAWRWGLIVVMALFPSMMIGAPPSNGSGLWAVGLMTTGFLALLGVAVSAAAGEVRKWVGRTLR